ncbi:MAG TPA: carotenoid biosynthesis protein [bacterium]|nr:carotenoid biosynthesis protein [bacterium]
MSSPRRNGWLTRQQPAEQTKRFGLLRTKYLQKYLSGMKIGGLYFVLLAGGLWHLLGIFQTTMRILAGPVIVLIGLWLAGEYYRTCSPRRRVAFVLWSLGVVGISFVIEMIGAQTGSIFGPYQYGQVLQPVINGVPVAIGFAWLGMLLASDGLVEWVLRNLQQSWLLRAFLIALVMVVFDILLEQVAVTLGYWHWFDTGIPLWNYVAWFVISLAFAVSGLRMGALPIRAPGLAKHMYFAQTLYFGLVLLR